MNILVVNSGSSSIKYQLFKMPDESPVCTGLIERIGLEESVVTHKINKNGNRQIVKETFPIANHEIGLREVARLLTDAQSGVIDDPADIDVVGHRVVHGGETFAATTVVTDEVKEEIKKLIPLVPLHNPANLKGIEVAEKIFSNAKQVAVFDTAFHQTMPAVAYRYALPSDYYTELGIRAYGFHGTSHKYVSEKAIQYLENPWAKVITIHLGNGCSITAVDGGKSIDSSMGFGPLSGLVMGTRSGDIDPSIIFHLTDQLGFSLEQVKAALNKHSGMQGLAGFSDMRDITKAVEEGNKNAELALNIYCYRIKKYIGSYAAIMNGLDAIVFTAGVGENAENVRELVCKNMSFLGIDFDNEKNTAPSDAIREINAADSKVKVLVIPTNEELEIAQQCYQLLS